MQGGGRRKGERINDIDGRTDTHRKIGGVEEAWTAVYAYSVINYTYGRLWCIDTRKAKGRKGWVVGTGVFGRGPLILADLQGLP